MATEDQTKRFEELGATRVRLMLLGGQLPTNWFAPASQWLSEIEDRERASNEAAQREQIRTARIAKNAAIVAAIAAVISIILTIISIAIAARTNLAVVP